jgi:hypothetical protein
VDLFSAPRSQVIDGTLIERHASIKSFRPEGGDDSGDSGGFKPRKPEADFRGERPSNQTYRSSNDPQARLYRKSYGLEAMLCHMGHVTSENRNGLVMSVAVTAATGHAVRELRWRW